MSFVCVTGVWQHLHWAHEWRRSDRETVWRVYTSQNLGTRFKLSPMVSFKGFPWQFILKTRGRSFPSYRTSKITMWWAAPFLESCLLRLPWLIVTILTMAIPGYPVDSSIILWMDEIHFAYLETIGHDFIGIYAGIIIIGFLGWCETDFALFTVSLLCLVSCEDTPHLGAFVILQHHRSLTLVRSSQGMV